MLFLSRFPNGRPLTSSSPAASVPSPEQHPVASNKNEMRSRITQTPTVSRGRQPSPTRSDDPCSTSAIASSRQRSLNAPIRSANISNCAPSVLVPSYLKHADLARCSSAHSSILPQNAGRPPSSVQTNPAAPSPSYRGWRPDQLPQHRPRATAEHCRAEDHQPLTEPQRSQQPIPPVAGSWAYPPSPTSASPSLIAPLRSQPAVTLPPTAATATPPNSRPWSSNLHAQTRPSATSQSANERHTTARSHLSAPPAASMPSPARSANYASAARQSIPDAPPPAAVLASPLTSKPIPAPPTPPLPRSYSTRQAAPSTQLNRVGRATPEEIKAFKHAAQSPVVNHQQTHTQHPPLPRPRSAQHTRHLQASSSVAPVSTTGPSQVNSIAAISTPALKLETDTNCVSPEDATIGPRRDVWLSVYQETPDGTAYVFQSHQPITQWPTQHSMYSRPESGRRKPRGRRFRSSRSRTGAAAVASLTYADVDFVKSVAGGLRLSTADSRSEDGQWSSFLVGVRGSIGKDESETSWPNKARYSHRIRYNIRSIDDVLRMLAETPSEYEVEYHLMSLARTLDRSARFIWAKLVQAYGARELADTGFSMLRVEQTMVQCQLAFQRNQAGGQARQQSWGAALQFR